MIIDLRDLPRVCLNLIIQGGRAGTSLFLGEIGNGDVVSISFYGVGLAGVQVHRYASPDHSDLPSTAISSLRQCKRVARDGVRLILNVFCSLYDCIITAVTVLRRGLSGKRGPNVVVPKSQVVQFLLYSSLLIIPESQFNLF